jgi:hypothetical protein
MAADLGRVLGQISIEAPLTRHGWQNCVRPLTDKVEIGLFQ